MAITTLLTARTELQARGYSRFTAGRLDNWLNTAKNRFEDFPYDWPWLKATASGATPLTVADLRRVLVVFDATNRRPLEQVDADDIIDYEDTNIALTGPAYQWYLTSDTVLASYPVGTASLSVRYIKFSPELSADGDTPLIPARYRQTWVDLAEVDALRYGVKDQAAASAMEVEVFARLAEIAGVYSMMRQPANTEQFMTGQSVDG